MDLEFLFFLENLVAIALGIFTLVIGFRFKERLYSDEARQNLMANWRKYSVGISLFGLSLFVYFVAESSRFLIPFYPGWDLDEVHEWGEIIHMSLLIVAMALSTVLAVNIGRSKR